ncbi:MAG: hypothetical protein ACTSYO_05760 [Candidatus Ranarchaeia archaeon]
MPNSIDVLATMGMIHDYLLDERVLNLVYNSDTGTGRVRYSYDEVDPDIKLMATLDDDTPPIALAVIDVRKGFGPTKGQYLIGIHSPLLNIIEVRPSIIKPENRAVEAVGFGMDVRIPLEHPESLPTIVTILESIVQKYNDEIVETWNLVNRHLFENHVVYDELELNNLKLKR